MVSTAPKRDALLTCVHRYTLEHVKPFIRSLQRTGYEGRTVFFHSEMNPEALTAIEGEGIETVPSGFRQWPGKRPLRKVWIGLRWLPESYRAKLIRMFSPLTFYRHFAYLDFLREEHSRLRRVFLIDVRDVIFQAQPFPEELQQGVHAFELDRRRTIGTEGANRDWILTYFGRGALQVLHDEPILCAGTILGEAQALVEFLEFFTSVLCRVRRIGSKGGDQGVFNHALRLGSCPPVTVHRNGAAGVLTLSGMPESAVRANPEGEVVDDHARVIPVLHCTDRHPALHQSLLRRFLA